MLTHTIHLKDQLIHAHQLLNQPTETTGESKHIEQAFNIYQSAISNPQYATLDAPMRASILLSLVKLIELLPENKEKILAILVNQFFIEINLEKNTSSDLLLKILTQLQAEKDSKYIKDIFNKCYQLSKTIIDINKEVICKVLEIKILIFEKEQESEAKAEVQFELYQSFFVLMQKGFNQKLVKILIDKLSKFIVNFPQYKSKIIPFMEHQFLLTHQMEILNFLIQDKEQTHKLIVYFSQKILSDIEKRSSVFEADKLHRILEPNLLSLEYIANNTQDKSSIILAHKHFLACVLKLVDNIAYFLRGGWDLKKITQIDLVKNLKKTISTCRVIKQLSLELKENLDEPTLVNAHETIIKHCPTPENFLEAASIGNIGLIIKAAEFFANHDPSKAIDLYLIAIQDGINFNRCDENNIIKFFAALINIKNTYQKISSEQAESIKKMTLLAFSKFNFIKIENAKHSELTKEFLKLSLKETEQLISELDKKHINRIEFLTLAEKYFAAQQLQNSDAQDKFNLYSRLKREMENEIGAIGNEVETLTLQLNKSNSFGQHFIEWIRHYFSIKNTKIEINSTQCDSLLDKLINILKDYLNKNDFKGNPYLDLIAFLSTQGSNKNALHIQKKLTEQLLIRAERIKIIWGEDSWKRFEQCRNVFERNLILSYNCFNFISFLISLSKDSPFYEFNSKAQQTLTSLREKIDEAIAMRMLAVNFDKDYTPYDIPNCSFFTVRLFSCPVALSEAVNELIPRWTRLTTSERKALVASTCLLILSKNRKLEAEIIENYFPNYSYLIQTRHIRGDKWIDDVSHPVVKKSQNEIINKLRNTIHRAETFLKAKAADTNFEYYEIAKFLWECVEKVEKQSAAQPDFIIENAIIYLWREIFKHPFKPEQLNHLAHGLENLIVSPEQWIASVRYLDAAYGRDFSMCLEISAPELEVKAIDSASAPPEEKAQTLPTPDPIATPLPTSVSASIPAVHAPVKIHYQTTADGNPVYALPEEWDPEKLKIKQEKKKEKKSLVIVEDTPSTAEGSALANVVVESPPPSTLVATSPAATILPAQERKRPAMIETQSVVEPVSVTAATPKAVSSFEGMTSLEEEIEPGAANYLKAEITLTEPTPGILSVSAQLFTHMPTPVAFAIFGAHLLFENHSVAQHDRPMKINNSCIYLDAPDCLSPGLSTSTQTRIAITVAESKNKDFKVVNATVTTPAITPTQLNLSLFSQPQVVEQNAPLVSRWVVKV